jgi:hypothetical protein
VAYWVTSKPNRENRKVAEVVVWFKDKELEKRWRCSGMKLWRMRKAGKLNSIKIAGGGVWLTSEEEVERIESVPPEKPAPKGAVKNRDAA